MKRINAMKIVLGVVPMTQPMVRLRLETALQWCGCEVLLAESPRQAAGLCQRRKVDAVVLDLPRSLNMCWEFFAQLRALAPGVPMILLTNQATPFEQEVAAEVGALLAKPFRVPELVHTLSVLLAQAPGAGQSAPPSQVSFVTSFNRT